MGGKISLLCELEDQKNSVLSFFKDKSLKPKEYCFLPIDRRPSRLPDHLKERFEQKLKKENEFEGLVITTEAKAHHIYLDWAVDNDVAVLMDKPLFTPSKMESMDDAQSIYQYFKRINQKVKKKNQIAIMTQRRHHNGYLFIWNYLRRFLLQFGIPISFISIFHSDGMWNMPTELNRENHPYKYGSGKLSHSGYHFVDLFCWFAQLNYCLPSHKHPQRFTLFNTSFLPSDSLHQIPPQEYSKFFSKELSQENSKENSPSLSTNFSSTFSGPSGELDSYSTIQLLSQGRVLTTGVLSLLQNGFSRRAWYSLPKDIYKGNGDFNLLCVKTLGRVRHEHVTITVGPLLSIEVHSYESYESSKPPTHPSPLPWETGGDRHFEIFLFRNSELVGGKPFEKLTFGLEGDEMNAARESLIKAFLDEDKHSISNFSEQEWTNFFLGEFHANHIRKARGQIPYSEGELPPFETIKKP